MTIIIFLSVLIILFIKLGSISVVEYTIEKNLSRRLKRNGLEAHAVLLSAQPIGNYRNNMIKVKLQVQVQPEKGRNFVTETKELISKDDFELIPIGSKIKVKYNPANTAQIMRIIS